MFGKRGLRAVTVLLMLAVSAAGAAADDAAALRGALQRADAGDHAGAAHSAAMARDPVVQELAAWRRLLDGQGSFAEMRRMIESRTDWPRMTQLRRQAERAMGSNLSPQEVIGFFRGQPPLTVSGAMALAAAQSASGDPGSAQATLTTAWRRLDMTQAEREAFQARHGDIARANATARLDELLWRGAHEQARAILPLVDPGWRALAEARIALRNRADGVNALINAVPASLAGDAGLAYERFVWRARADMDAEAEQMLMQRTGSAEALGRPEEWAGRRASFARRAFREGRVADAYRMASLHHLTSGTDFADLEWLSGWIALRGLNDPVRAAGHFLRQYNDVATPISLGRGAYWLGRAYEAAGDGQRARMWYERASEHATTFYGQLAAERIGRDITALKAERSPADWRRARWAEGDTARALRLLQRAGRDGDVRAFVTAMANGMTMRDDFAALADMAMAIGRPDGAVVATKAAARQGIILMDYYYPVLDVVAARGPVEPAFALAIARQESEMHPGAVSHAGARGLMQLMPGTAQKVARDLGIAYDLGRLTSDPAYNVRLGQTYLAEMLNRFGGANILAAAAYNAGPHRVDQWLGRFGDPRRGVDPIDWIEHIPFYETRNYVQRVMEGLHVYRARLGQGAAPSYMAALTRPQG
ncbi:MAG: transglycosylase SLT domain-containing protein [Rubrimonas sp.]